MYAKIMFALICAQHPNASTLVLVNDIPVDIRTMNMSEEQREHHLFSKLQIST